MPIKSDYEQNETKSVKCKARTKMLRMAAPIADLNDEKNAKREQEPNNY